MPPSKPNAPLSKTSGPEADSGQQQQNLTTTDLLKEHNRLRENALQRLQENARERRELERIIGAFSGQPPFGARTGIRKYIREALASGKKMSQTEIADAIVALGYVSPSVQGPKPAVDQALRAMKKAGEVEHLTEEKLWRLPKKKK